MKLSRAILAAILGCIVVLLVVWLAGRLTNADSDLSALAGAVVTAGNDPAAWLVGLAIQIVIAMLAALVYAALFEGVTRRAGALVGLAIAVPHAVIAGLVVGFLPAAPLAGAGIMPPGAFLEYRGLWCVAGFVAAHLAFGAILGAVYGATRHTSEVAPVRWREIA